MPERPQMGHERSRLGREDKLRQGHATRMLTQEYSAGFVAMMRLGVSRCLARRHRFHCFSTVSFVRHRTWNPYSSCHRQPNIHL
jgi:hypothetical protein